MIFVLFALRTLCGLDARDPLVDDRDPMFALRAQCGRDARDPIAEAEGRDPITAARAPGEIALNNSG